MSEEASTPAFPEVILETLPEETILPIFQYLSDVDLCHLALCNRWLREVTNNNMLWRCLCQQNGWERYGTVMDLNKMVPTLTSQERDTGSVLYVPPPGFSASFESLIDLIKEVPILTGQETDNEICRSNKVSFQSDAIIGNHLSGLVATCKWKETYMKARHLESNWEKGRFHTDYYDFNKDESYDRMWIRECESDGDYIVIWVVALSGDEVQKKERIEIWDVQKKSCQHVITMEESKCSKILVKNGILVVGKMNGMISTFSTQTGQALQVMKVYGDQSVHNIFFDGETVVSNTSTSWHKNNDNDGIHVWSVIDGVCQHILKGGSTLRHLETHIDYRDKIVAAAYYGNCLRIWDANSGACVHTLELSEPDIPPIALKSIALGEGIVASLVNVGGGSSLLMKIWSTTSGQCIKTFRIGDGLPSNVVDKVYNLVAFHTLEVNNNLLNVLMDHRTYSNSFQMFYKLTGELVQHFSLYNIDEEFDGKFYQHGNKVIGVGKIEGVRQLSECFHIYKVTPNGLKYINSCSGVYCWDSPLRARTIIFMDETKICFAYRHREVKGLHMYMYIRHYW